MRVSAVLALALTIIGSPAYAQDVPIVLSVDASPGPVPGTEAWRLPGVAFAWAVGILQSSQDRKAAELGAELRAALPFDLLDEASRKLTPPESLGGAGAPVVALPDASGEALTKLLMERGWREALHVRYIALPDRRFWSRLLVTRVRLADDGPVIEPLATAYYLTGFSKDLWHTRDGWSPAALDAVQREIEASFVELSALWARIAEDSAGGADPRTKWASLPPMPHERDAWPRCWGANNCRDQRLVQVTGSRAWITSPQGPVLVSADRGVESALNFTVIPMAIGLQ
jgi:hypothetical protein